MRFLQKLELFLLLLPAVFFNYVSCVTEASEAYYVPIIVLTDEAEPKVVHIDEQSEPMQILTAYKTIESVVYEIPQYPGMKKWLDYRCYKGNTRQAKLQKYATTDSLGLRQIDGCYCVAIGTRFNTQIGQRIDLLLQNGTIIPCVVADHKANVHTDATNTFSNTTRNLCCSEFVVSTNDLEHEARHRGDTSFVAEIWESPVDKIITYNINILEDIDNGEYPTKNLSY